MNQTRTLCCVLTAAILVLLLAMVNHWSSVAGEALRGTLKTALGPSHVDNDTSFAGFEEIALKHGTDKVTTHKYQFMYDKYLRAFQGKPIKLLEIGLGCNMEYGPGASYYTWLEFLPGVELYFIEYDAQCAEKYKHKTSNAHVFTGDQADTDFLQRFAAETTADEQLFDVIIDDGGHTMNQQITSLEHLWNIVKPGGYYFIEDLQTSFWELYGGDPSATDPEKHTTVKYLFNVINDMMENRQTEMVGHELRSIDCMAEICALTKKESDEIV